MINKFEPSSLPQENNITEENTNEQLSIENILRRFKRKDLAERQRIRYEKAENKEEILKDILEIAEEEEEFAKEKFLELLLEDDLLEKHANQKNAIAEVVQEAIKKGDFFEGLGRGNVAVVAKSEIHPKYCYKVIHNPEDYKKENNVIKETQIAMEAIFANNSKVKIPETFYRIANKKTHLYVMETINGCSLRYLFLDKNNGALKNFNLDTFFNELQKCLDSLHSAGIHHRDMHAGNVMVEEKTGLPALIDFGKSVILSNPDEDAYFQEIDSGAQKGTQTWMIDNIKIKELKNDINKMLIKTNS